MNDVSFIATRFKRLHITLKLNSSLKGRVIFRF